MAIELTPGTGLELSLQNRVIGIASRVGRAYILRTKVPTEQAYSTIQADPELAHRRLGHLSYSTI